MDSEIGIRAWGGYVPRLRLERKAMVEANAWFQPGLRAHAKGERAMCNWDEDTLTMAVEAARDCLGGAGRSANLASVHLASTTAPFADRQNATVLATALALGESIGTSDVGASQRAGTSGLIEAFSSARGRGDALFVAAEDRLARAGGTAELTNGSGAAAVLIGTEAPAAVFIDSEQTSVDFVDHYREQGRAFDYPWEERWVRDEGYLKVIPRTVQRLLERVSVEPGSIDHFILPCTLRGVPQRLARTLGIDESAIRDNLHPVMGEAGAAHPLVMLAQALESASPGQYVLVLGWGQGCDALLLRTTEALVQGKPRRGITGSLARRRAESNYHKFLAFNDLVERDLGMRAEVDRQTPLSTLYRNREMVLALVGGECRVCGTAQYPKSNVCINPNCGEFHSQDPYPFAERAARVLTWTADNLTFSADPPAHFGIVQFEQGGRMMAEFTDVDVGAVEVGMPMRMVFRIKEHDTRRGFKKYFWKATPNLDPDPDAGRAA